MILYSAPPPASRSRTNIPGRARRSNDREMVLQSWLKEKEEGAKNLMRTGRMELTNLRKRKRGGRNGDRVSLCFADDPKLNAATAKPLTPRCARKEYLHPQ